MMHSYFILPITQIPPYEDIRGPVFLWDWLIIGWISSGILIVALMVYFIFRRKKESPPEEVIIKPEASGVALSELSALRKIAEGMEAERFTVRITSILRNYLEDALTIPAPELTTEEFLETIASRKDSILNTIMPAFLQQCDLVKFARQSLEHASRNKLINQAEELVTKTKVEQENASADERREAP